MKIAQNWILLWVIAACRYFFVGNQKEEIKSLFAGSLLVVHWLFSLHSFSALNFFSSSAGFVSFAIGFLRTRDSWTHAALCANRSAGVGIVCNITTYTAERLFFPLMDFARPGTTCGRNISIRHGAGPGECRKSGMSDEFNWTFLLFVEVSSSLVVTRDNCWNYLKLIKERKSSNPSDMAEELCPWRRSPTTPPCVTPPSADPKNARNLFRTALVLLVTRQFTLVRCGPALFCIDCTSSPVDFFLLRKTDAAILSPFCFFFAGFLLPVCETRQWGSAQRFCSAFLFLRKAICTQHRMPFACSHNAS